MKEVRESITLLCKKAEGLKDGASRPIKWRPGQRVPASSHCHWPIEKGQESSPETLKSLMFIPMKRTFSVIIERDIEGWLVATVPGLDGCHTQARSFDELNDRVREAIAVCLEDAGDESTEFVGIQQVAIEI